MSGKTFIVTGASRGLGAAIAGHLLDQGHRVVASARSAQPLERLRAAYPGRAEYLVGDMADLTTVTKLTDLAVKAFGRIDGVVINHGIVEIKSLAEQSMDMISHTYQVNVISGIALVKASLVELRKTKGCIVWVSSGASTKTYKGWGCYGSSKAAVNSLSSHFAAEEADITSISIQPGRVDTDMQGQIRETGSHYMDKAAYDSFVQAKNAGQLLQPEQPGNVIARVVASPPKELSGKLTTWNSPELAAYQE